MNNPVFVDCPADTWTLVASDVKGGLIHRYLTTPTKYSWAYRLAGGDPPTSESDGVVVFTENEPLKIPPSSGIDIYIFAYDKNGSVRVDALTEFTDVAIQDQTTQAVIAKFNQVQGGSTTTALTVIGGYTIEVADATDFSAGSYVVMYSTIIDRYYVGYVLSIAGGVLTMDTPLDAAYPVGSPVGSAITNMNVDGSGIPEVFGLRGSPVQNPLNLVFDITRIIFNCTTDDAVDLSKFADIAGGLTRGLVLRKRDGEYFNIFNVKTNGDIAGVMYDFTVEQASNPAQGQNGFYARLTFAGPEKIGVVQRLAEGEDLEFLIQDDLTSILKFEVVAEGHVVD